ncbi:MAG: RNA polymerase sigma factor [Candidatus Omnitrophica bacterium]|nr:RNA polymerase sigma factor [Candidatus Omnitrophota bacterium]
MDDFEFIRKCCSGNRQSWEEFVDKYSRLIYNYIYAVLRSSGVDTRQDTIKDIFQEIYLILAKDNYKKLRAFKAKNGCSLASWLRLVVVNFTIDHLRKQKQEIFLDQQNDEELSLKDILADKSEPVLHRLIAEENSADLADCFRKLQNDDRYFLELHINQALPLEELKVHLKVSRGAVDMRKSRIIAKLKECFKRKGYELPVEE